MRAVLLVGALLLIAVAGWFAFMANETDLPTPGLVSAAERDASPGEPADGAPVAADEPTVVTADAAQRASAATAASERSEAPPIPADAKWFEIKIVDGASKEAVAGADVFWSTELAWEHINRLPPREREDLWTDEERVLRRFGWHAQSDAHGIVRVTAGKDATQVVARAGDRFGSGWFNETQLGTDNVVELLPDETLQVHVCDAAGRDAAGVPVEIAQHDPASNRPPQFWSDRKLTASDGIARFVHVQRQQKWQWGPNRGQPVKALAIAATAPGLDVAPTTVDPSALPAEPVELRLPPTGHLRVRLTMAGKPFLRLERLELDLAPVTLDARGHWWSALVDDQGWARYAHLPLGKTFGVGTNPWQAECAECTGPTLPDQEVVAELEIGDRVVALAGRMLTADGEPASGQRVHADYELHKRHGSEDFTTDASGRFEWIARRADAGEQEFELKRLTLALIGRESAQVRADVAARVLRPGHNDLGDVRLGEAPLVVGGRLVYDCDPPRRSDLGIERFTASTEPGKEGRWRRIDDRVQKKVRDDGTFSVRGDVEPGRYRVTIAAFDHLPVEPVEFALGTEQLEVRVECGARLDAVCVMPESIEPMRLWVTLVPAKAEPQDEQRGPMGSRLRAWPANNRSAEVRYRWQALRAATYTLRIEGSGRTMPLVEIPDVVVPPPAGGDARLARIDLGDVLRALRVRLHFNDDTTGGGGQPEFRAAVVFPLPQPERGTWNGSSLRDTTAVLPVPRSTVDIMVAAPGYRPVTLRGVGDEADVYLDPWPSAELHFAATTLPAGVELLASIADPQTDPSLQRSYEGDWGGGRLELEPRARPVVVKDGRARLPVGDTVQRLQVSLRLGTRSQRLQQVSPGEISAGPPIAVLLADEEIRTVAEALQKEALQKPAANGR